LLYSLGMSTITFDTQELVRELKNSGIASEQADAIVRTIVKSHDGLATKHDIERLELKLEGKFALLQWMLAAVLAIAIANFAKQFF
jgi:hypothetical protein